MLKHNRIRESAEAHARGLRAIALVAALLLILAGAATAQILYGALTGNVADQTGAVLPKAHVEALNAVTGIVRSMDVDSSGSYYFAELQPGLYTVTVSAQGFSKTSIEARKKAKANAENESRATSIATPL